MQLTKFALSALLSCVMFVLSHTALLADEQPFEAPPAPETRIDPAGIPGSLVIADDELPDEALRVFLDLASGKRAEIVIVRTSTDRPAQELTARLLSVWETSGANRLEVVRIENAEGPAAQRLKQRLESATGVWLAGGGEAFRELVASPVIDAALTRVMQKGGVVGGAAQNGRLIAEHVFEDQATARAPRNGLALLPGSLVDIGSAAEDNVESRLLKALQKTPGVVGYELGENAAMAIRGRRVRLIGDGDVRIHLAAGKDRPASQVLLNSKQRYADLTALRLSARYRTELPFPAKKPPSPIVENGTLIVIGGGGMPKGIIEKFVTLAGGDDSHIIVLPTAMPDPIVVGRRGIHETFRRAGAKSVQVLPGRTLDEVESDEYLAAFKKATGIWFGGGRQWRFADAYLNTKVYALMHDVLKRGGVIMGSSAGASIQADYLARANPLGNRDIMAEGYERGLAFLRGSAVDQHFAQRSRFKDMTQLVDRYPQLLGIGIDETTAIVVQKNIAEVVGRGGVHFYDRRKPVKEGKPDYETVPAGGRYDLVARKVVEED